MFTFNEEMQVSEKSAELELLEAEHGAFWDLARERFRTKGRGALLIGRSQSLSEIQEQAAVSTYIVDYLLAIELRDPSHTSPDQKPSTIVEKIVVMMLTYDPAQEFLAIFTGGGGFEKVFRVQGIKRLGTSLPKKL